jgi:hypothetical protein
MPTLEAAAQRLTRALNHDVGYDAGRKAEFGSAAKSFLRAWMKRHNVVAHEGIRWNKGGIAVSGEVRLVTDTYEIEVFQSCFKGLPPIMFRSRWEASIGHNHFATPNEFASMSFSHFKQRIGCGPMLQFKVC